MENKQIIKRSLLMAAFFFVFYLVILFNRDGGFEWFHLLESLLASVLFIFFYYLFGKFIRPLFKKKS